MDGKLKEALEKSYRTLLQVLQENRVQEYDLKVEFSRKEENKKTR